MGYGKDDDDMFADGGQHPVLLSVRIQCGIRLYGHNRSYMSCVHISEQIEMYI